LLLLCNSYYNPLKLIDAFFTATSAVCVTGLIVVDTGTDLSPASQMTVLLLIQLGGIGVMTAATTFSLLLGERIGLRQRMLFAGGFGMDTPSGVIKFLIKILLFTLMLEAVGAIPLFMGFLKAGLTPFKAFCSAVFHSISAFCNAGFSLFPDNLEGFSQSFIVSGTIMALIVLGGLGFPVLTELAAVRKNNGKRLSLHSRLVLTTTVILILSGLFLFTISEWNTAFAHLPEGWKIWNGLFASITPRTAGFDTISPSTFSSAGLFVLVLFMIVGASPGSTGGGFKTTTLAVLVLSAWNTLRRRPDVVLWNRRIPFRILQRTIAVSVLYLSGLGLGILALSIMEPLPFRELLFEAASALGTVGLSLGITAQLSTGGKIVLILLMFWGRVGILTFIFGLLKGEFRGNVSYPDADIPIG